MEIPRSVPELTTERLLVMSFVEGDQITRLEHRTKDLSARCGTSAAHCPFAAHVTCAFADPITCAIWTPSSSTLSCVCL